MSIHMEAVYAPSDDVVAREIDGDIIIVPLAGGIGSLEDEFFSLNETGREVWRLLDGKRSLAEVIKELTQAYEADQDVVERDVQGLLAELLQRNMLVAVG